MAYIKQENSLSQLVYHQGENTTTLSNNHTVSSVENKRILRWLLEVLGSLVDLKHLSARYFLEFLVLLEYPFLLFGLEVLLDQYLANLVLP